MKRLLAASVASLILLAGCAAPSQPFLDHYRQSCTAGDRAACDLIPQAQARVNAEKQDQAGQVAEGFLKVLGALVLVAGAAAEGYAAGVAASQPVYYHRPATVYVAPQPVNCVSLAMANIVSTSCN